MVQFSNLVNDQDNRKVREVIMSSNETINVFEPSKKDIAFIVDMQGDAMNGEETLKVTGVEMVRELIPLLTDIEGLEDLTNEEVEFIIDNPTIALVQVQHAIEMIVTEVYKTVILSAKKSILEMDYEVEAYKAEENMLNNIISSASKKGKPRELINKIEEQYEDLQNTIQKAEQEEKTAQESKEDSVSPVMADLESYRKTFAEKE